jgi:hypothetical protein
MDGICLPVRSTGVAKGESVALIDLLDRYFNQSLEALRKCSNVTCASYEQSFGPIHQARLTSVPEYLIITFDRMEYNEAIKTSRKSNVKVDVPEALDLAAYMIWNTLHY